MILRLITIALLSVLSVGQMAAQNYKLVWSDEFDSNTLGTNWNVEVVSNPSNNEMQYYLKDNVTIENGNLVITAKKQAKGNKSFTSGRVNSNNKVSFKHGKIEARIKMPKLNKGLWPAFWMMGEDITTKNWPYCGEIDIMEAGHKDAITKGVVEKQIAACLHWGSDMNHHEMTPFVTYNANQSLTDDYHIFTCIWDENSISFYLDNSSTPYRSVKLTDANKEYFNKPFHILFNLAVGGDYPSIYSMSGITALTSSSPAKMYVDWVRVYQEEDKNNITFPITNLSSISIFNISTDSNIWYTLMGVPIVGEPTKRGLYICNRRVVRI